ncbi:MAG: HupE/UreJ family protein [Rhodoferax sp.]
MQRNTASALRGIGLLALGLAGGAAHAHTGHGTVGFMMGLAHPLGWDHTLAMVAVGLWSVKAWPLTQVWKGPMAFLAALLVAGVLGSVGWTLPFMEHLIAASVVVFGAMLVAGGRALPAATAVGVIALAGALHGWAHGAEAPAAGFGAYALGFVFTTAALHALGLAAGLGLRRALGQRSDWITPLLGAVLGGVGVVLLGQ